MNDDGIGQDKPSHTGLAYGLQPHADVRLNRIYTKTASELATLIVRLDDRVRAGLLRCLRLGVPEADKVVKTMSPGTLTVITARPSHRKSSTMKHVARLECERIVTQGREHEEMVIYATLEESDEEVALKVVGAPFGVEAIVNGDVERADTIAWSDRVAGLPLATIGHHRTEISRAITDRPPRLTVEQAYREVVQLIEDDERRPTALFLDYIQKAASESRFETERNQKVAYVVGQLVDIAKHLDVPAVVAAQAGRQVDERVPPIPAIGDNQWSSSLEQDADVVLACWYPFKTEIPVRAQLAAKFRVDPMPFENAALTFDELMRPETFVLSLRKQRMGVGAGLWVCRVDPVTGALSAWPRPTLTTGGAR